MFPPETNFQAHLVAFVLLAIGPSRDHLSLVRYSSVMAIKCVLHAFVPPKHLIISLLIPFSFI